MSLGIKSVWRARSRCSAFTGPFLISRASLPSRTLNFYTAFRFESTTAQAKDTNSTKSSETALVSLSDRSRMEVSVREPEQVIANLDNLPASRNRAFKDAFRVDAPKVAEDKEAMKVFKALIAKPLQYPNELATKASLEEHLRDKRRQAGLSIVWNHFNKKIRDWTECFSLMKRMTPQWSERASMSAVRIVLPKSWDIEVNNQNLEYVDSATGVLRKLRAAVDRNPSAIVLRGQSKILVKVADEIVRHCKEAEIYELGEVASSDYRTRQLWPTIENAPNGGASLPEDHSNEIWVHKEYQQHFITVPYEKIPRPAVWTQDSFEQYIATLCYGKIPAHLAIPFYGERRANGRFIDTDGIRVKLVVDAFQDRTARPFITAPVLKMAISMMAFRGGHRASASHLVQLGEEWGTPMDTDMYNIMLEGYVHKHDNGFFYGFLRRMQARYHHPNIRTWLLFLQLIKGEDERRQVIVAMFQLGMFNHAATRRGIADVMAPMDAYAALKAGTSLKTFLAEQNERYSKGWLATDGLNGIITEFLRFHRPEDPRIEDCKTLVDMHTNSGHRLEMKTINIFIRHAALARDWDTAFWALGLCKDTNCVPDQETYASLMSLAIQTRSPHALGTIYFYGVLNRKLKKSSRQMLSRILLRTHRDHFWRKVQHQPGIFPRQAIPELHYRKIRSFRNVMSRVERVVLDKWAGYVPAKSLERSLDLAYRSNDEPMHRQIRTGQSIQVQDLIVRLRRADGQPGNINVRLKGRFDPARMIENWKGIEAESDEQESHDTDEPDSWPDLDTLEGLPAEYETTPEGVGDVRDAFPGVEDPDPSSKTPSKLTEDHGIDKA